MNDFKVPGYIGCIECGGSASYKGRGYNSVMDVRLWFVPVFKRKECSNCCGRGIVPRSDAPPFPPSRSRTATTPEVVILNRHKGGIGTFAVVCVGGEEIGEIPILKAQSFEDEFYESLRVTIQNLVEGTCRT